jgi:prepilin-type processing-associated H-X9-DG protein
VTPAQQDLGLSKFFNTEKPKNIRYHRGGWNYLFCDGRVESLLPQETIGENGTLYIPHGLWSNTIND